jgi:protocatechuate 3,4-dioxygenase beta subunit
MLAMISRETERRRSREEKGMSDIYDLGLKADVAMWLKSPLERRRILQLGALGIGTLLSSSSLAQAAACVGEIPEETAGPYPGDGSNGANALALSGIVRSDIRSSLSTGTVAEGVPLTVQLQLVNSNADCAPLAGYAIYLWHCSREGLYSMYSSGVTDEDYLRGVQETDSEGNVTFTSIFPACYAGRWPHIHFEMYPSLAAATNGANKVHTSQLALPQDVCDIVYATDGYSQSVNNLAQITLESDNVFSDGVEQQMASVTGNTTDGYLATLVVGIAV